MDKKEIARRSDALYADGVRCHRRDLCDMIAYREADIEQLRTDVEQLRKTATMLASARTGLLAKNAKLRKLARKMLKPFYWAQSGYEVCLSDEEDREIRDMLRELRIEAKDG